MVTSKLSCNHKTIDPVTTGLYVRPGTFSHNLVVMVVVAE